MLSSNCNEPRESDVEWECVRARFGRQLLGGNLDDGGGVESGGPVSTGEEGELEKAGNAGFAGIGVESRSRDMTMLSMSESRSKAAEARDRSCGSSEGLATRCRFEYLLLVLPCRWLSGLTVRYPSGSSERAARDGSPGAFESSPLV